MILGKEKKVKSSDSVLELNSSVLKLINKIFLSAKVNNGILPREGLYSLRLEDYRSPIDVMAVKGAVYMVSGYLKDELIECYSTRYAGKKSSVISELSFNVVDLFINSDNLEFDLALLLSKTFNLSLLDVCHSLFYEDAQEDVEPKVLCLEKRFDLPSGYPLDVTFSLKSNSEMYKDIQELLTGVLGGVTFSSMCEDFVKGVPEALGDNVVMEASLRSSLTSMLSRNFSKRYVEKNCIELARMGSDIVAMLKNPECFENLFMYLSRVFGLESKLGKGLIIK